MYTLERVLDLVNGGDDIYCGAYKTDRYLIEGWLSDLDLDPDTRIESYGIDYYEDGDEYLVLHLA